MFEENPLLSSTNPPPYYIFSKFAFINTVRGWRSLTCNFPRQTNISMLSISKVIFLTNALINSSCDELCFFPSSRSAFCYSHISRWSLSSSDHKKDIFLLPIAPVRQLLFNPFLPLIHPKVFYSGVLGSPGSLISFNHRAQSVF